MGYQLGIDVGSANTIVALADESWPRVLELGGQRRLPSVIYAPSGGELRFGRAAARRALTDPDRGVTDLLRRMGESGPVLLGGAAYSLESLLARLVGYVVETAAEQRGTPPDQVVVTFPSFWSPNRQEMFADAVNQLSGVTVPLAVRPAAEAVGLLLARTAATQTVDLVGWYDLGAGFLDTAVMSFSPFGFQVVGSPAGLRHAAGTDLDDLLVDRVLAAAGTDRAALDRSDPAVRAALARLRQEASQAKEILSDAEDVEVPVLVPGVDASVTLTRTDLETLIGPIVDDTVAVLRRALRSVPAVPGDLSRLLLSGGIAHMPLVGRRLRAAFGEIRRFDIGSDADIAMGAALIAAELAAAAGGGGGAGGGAGDQEQVEVTALIRPPDAASLTSLPPFMTGPMSGMPGISGPIVTGGVPTSMATEPVRFAGPGGRADANPPGGAGPADATVISGGAGQRPVPTPIPSNPPRAHPAGGNDAFAAGGLAGGLAGGDPSGDALAGLEATSAPGIPGHGGYGPPDQGGYGAAGPWAAGGAEVGPGGAHRAAAETGGGILGSRRAMVAAVIAAVVFVAGATTFGIVLAGRGSGSDSLAAVTADPTPSPSISAPTLPPATGTPSSAANTVRVAGSSEVAPITETAYNQFREVQRNVTVNVESTTTEDGFAALCGGRAELADASFELTPGSLKNPTCEKNLVGFEIAHETLPIVVNPQNTWLHCLTLKQVKQVWGADSSVTRWNQIDKSFPDQPINFVGPPRTSIQAQVFNATISEASDRSRSYKEADLSGVANDAAEDPGAMGFLDFPTFETFGSKLRGVEINNGDGCVAPNAVSVGTGLYLPLCKPLYIYARSDALRQPATAAFLRYYLQNGKKIAFDAHYVPRNDATVGENVARLDKLTTGVGPVPA